MQLAQTTSLAEMVASIIKGYSFNGGVLMGYQ